MFRRGPVAKPLDIYTVLALASLGVAACASGPEITATWQRPDYQAHAFKKISVIALSGRELMRRTIENHIVFELSELGMQAVAGMDLAPEMVQTEEQRAAIRQRLVEQGADGVIVLRVVERSITEHRDPAISFDPKRDFDYEYGIFFVPMGRAATVDATKTIVVEGVLYDLARSVPIAVRDMTVTDASNLQQIRAGAKLLVASFQAAGAFPKR